MKQSIPFILCVWGLAKAQVPLTLDPTVNGVMHISIEEEKATMLSDEVSWAFELAHAYQLMLQEEFHAENQLLRDRGSLTLSDGSVIPGNENVGTQIIDPRTPRGFGDPFFRKIHVEMNNEMNMSPIMKEALANTTSDIELPIGCTKLEDCIDYDRDGYDDSVKEWGIIIGKNITVMNANYKEETDLYINRTVYWNESKVDFVTAYVCTTSYGSTTCGTKEYVVNENAWDLEVALFPNGICPHPCECVKSLGATKRLGNDLSTMCYEYCAGSTLLDIFNCNILKAHGEKNKMNLKILLDERLPGWGPGLVMKRSHPLAGEVRRFLGIF